MLLVAHPDRISNKLKNIKEDNPDFTLEDECHLECTTDILFNEINEAWKDY